MTAIKKILITGANGFIGAHLTRKLLQEKFEIGILKREKSDLSRIQDIVPYLKCYNGDVRELDSISHAFSDFHPDAVMHLVTYYKIEHVASDVPLIADTNIRGTLNLLESAKDTGVGLFVNTSSCAVYRPSNQCLKESDPIAPQNLYALTKHHSEQECQFYADYSGLNSVSLRMFPPFGPGDHKRRLIPHVIQSLLNNRMPDLTTGKQLWDFLYIDDIIEAYLAVIHHSSAIKGHEIFNIGTGVPISVRDMVMEIMNQMDVRGEPRFGVIPHRKNEVWFNSADITKAKTVLGWEPCFSLEKGVEKTIEYFRKN
jgi:nucleoside-diphosphate-sugar epimerase